MKRQCTDPQIFPNTTAPVSAAMFTDNHHHPDLPYNSAPLPLTFSDAHISDPSHIQADPTPNNNRQHSDGATIETQRRARGRPPGSKNKPKSPNPNPTRLTQTHPNNLTNQPNHKHQILEIPNGADVIQAIAKHAVLNNTSLRILHTSGCVVDVTLRLPNHLQPIVTLGGRHDVVSLSAVFINPSSISSQINSIEAFNDVAITTMSSEKGEIVGGFVVGPLIACGGVYVLVESISNLTYHRLDVLEINANTASSGGGHQSPSADKVLNVPMYSDACSMPY